VADLAEAVGFDGFHEGFEDVAAVAGGLLEVGEAVGFRTWFDRLTTNGIFLSTTGS